MKSMLSLSRFRVVKRHPVFQASLSSLVRAFDSAVNELPLREAVRYTENNIRMTSKQFKGYCDNHAKAMTDLDFSPGDRVAVWLPESAEKHVILLAAAKLGFNIFDIDIKLTQLSEIRGFLQSSGAKIIYFKPEHEDTNYLLLLRKAIPEFFEYDDSHGQLFHSKHFPALKYFIHTGFDIENGCLNFKSLYLPDYSDPLPSAAAVESNLKYTSISKGASGEVVVSETLGSAKLLDVSAFSFAKKIINKEYFET